MRLITAEQLKKRLAKKEKPFLLDVRQDWEFSERHLSHSVNIPLPELEERLKELPVDREIVVICAHGRRSLIALDILKNRNAKSLSGGMASYH